MLTAEATVRTERASRYLTQLCRHADHMRHRMPDALRPNGSTAAPPRVLHAEATDTEGTIAFDAGRCTLRATRDTLLVRIEAPDHQGRQRIQDGLTDRLEKIGRRDGVQVDWQPSDTPAAPSAPTDTPAAPAQQRPPRRRARGQVLTLAAVGVLVIALHLGLGGALLESAPWAGWAADLVLAAVALKLLAIAAHILLGRWAIRRRKTSKAP